MAVRSLLTWGAVELFFFCIFVVGLSCGRNVDVQMLGRHNKMGGVAFMFLVLTV